MPKQGYITDIVHLLCLFLVTLVVLACLIHAFGSVLVHGRVCVISRVSFLSFNNSSSQALCQNEPSLRLGLGTNALHVGCVSRGGFFVKGGW